MGRCLGGNWDFITTSQAQAYLLGGAACPNSAFPPPKKTFDCLEEASGAASGGRGKVVGPAQLMGSSEDTRTEGRKSPLLGGGGNYQGPSANTNL